jgi:glycine dehydrogenase
VYEKGLKNANNTVTNELFFDTIKVKPNLKMEEIRKRAEKKRINLRYFEDKKHVGISLDETVTSKDIDQLLEIFNSQENFVNKPI